ncbi:MAG: hypothetical protein K0B06_06085 [Brevefilum sp.]|nr:hypothetical protein [Brevefilum sp.]
MKQHTIWIILSVLVIALASCGVRQEAQIDDDLVATQVSIILTQTALSIVAEPEPTTTPTLEPSPTEPEPEEEPTPTLTPTETPTSTPDQDDPAQRLGAPAWTVDFSGDSSPWDFETTQALFQTADGYLNLTARANPNWHSWRVSDPWLQNAYVEASIQMSTCAGADRFGLATRTSSDGQQFYFIAITCDGRWGFFRMSEDVNINTIIDFQSAEPLNAGLTEPHRVGIWMKGSDFTFYINGVEVGRAADATLADAGYTGFLIAFNNTNGFTTRVDTLKYWNVP